MLYIRDNPLSGMALLRFLMWTGEEMQRILQMKLLRPRCRLLLRDESPIIIRHNNGSSGDWLRRISTPASALLVAIFAVECWKMRDDSLILRFAYRQPTIHHAHMHKSVYGNVTYTVSLYTTYTLQEKRNEGHDFKADRTKKAEE
jgi:hypothetical protein